MSEAQLGGRFRQLWGELHRPRAVMEDRVPADRYGREGHVSAEGLGDARVRPGVVRVELQRPAEEAHGERVFPKVGFARAVQVLTTPEEQVVRVGMGGFRRSQLLPDTGQESPFEGLGDACGDLALDLENVRDLPHTTVVRLGP